jgi:hypothetical protein
MDHRPIGWNSEPDERSSSGRSALNSSHASELA